MQSKIRTSYIYRAHCYLSCATLGTAIVPGLEYFDSHCQGRRCTLATCVYCIISDYDNRTILLMED